MLFKFSGWALVFAIVVYAIIAWFTYGVAAEAREEHRRRNATLTATALVLIFNFVMYFISSFASDPSYQSSSEVARAGFDFESGKPYDLVLGARLGGVSGSMSGSGFFTAVNLKPGSLVSVSFTSKDGASYILDLPTSSVKFLPFETVDKPTVTIWLNDQSWNGKYGEPRTTDGSCALTFQSGIFVCSRVISREVVVPGYIRDAGLPPIVSDNFNHAEIRLSQKEYDRVLGRPSE